MITSYPDALSYLYENLPMFQRVGAVAFKKDLTNIKKLCDALGDPHMAFRSVHVAGTNGKGSTCHMLASILQVSGYKTGLYTSPHLKEFTERIRVDGREVPQEYIVDFVNRWRPLMEVVRPSFFEITVAMAFDFFRREGVDVAVIETGLGGRLDSTNVITPLVSVITNISWDHKELLGDTLPAIAREKAGIIKRGVPVVVSERQAEVEEVFVAAAHANDSPIFFASDEYAARREGKEGLLTILKGDEVVLEDVRLPLAGTYQRSNLPGVMKTVQVLQRDFHITPGNIRQGLEEVVMRTGLKGRWQEIRHNPTVMCDTGHNESGVREVLRQISAERFGRLFVVWGMVRDKDVKPILALLPKEALYLFCQAKIPRALDADVLRQEAAALGLRGEVVRDVNEAKRIALSRAKPDDFIYIGGSTFVVAEVEEL